MVRMPVGTQPGGSLDRSIIKMRLRNVPLPRLLAMACALGLIASPSIASARGRPGGFRLHRPAIAVDTVALTWDWSAGRVVRGNMRPIFEAEVDGRWVILGSARWVASGEVVLSSFPMYIDGAYRVRGRVGGFVSQPVEALVDRFPPNVAITSPDATNVAVEDRTVFDHPTAAIPSVTTFEADMDDLLDPFGVGVRRTTWVFENALTGESVAVVASEPREPVAHDFGMAPGAYQVTVLVEDHAGHVGMDVIDVVVSGAPVGDGQ